MTATSPSNKLAVVIPAYKPDYLAKALACVARQTDQRFNLYIYDDDSPADIQGIARSVLGARPYTYKRFANNLGGKSITQHWNRCVAESNEPWVWLFSDDDLMDDNCVEAFHKFLDANGEPADILHFGLTVVNEDDKLTAPVTVDLDRETGLEFAYGHFMGWRVTCCQNLVFRRSAFEEAGSFLDLPKGWWSDIAIVIALGRWRTIRRIPGARVFWRTSRQHISSDQSVHARAEKLRAACLFLYWFQGQLQKPREHFFAGDDASFRRAMDRFLVQQMMNAGLLPAIANWNLLSHTRAEVCNGSRLSLLKYIILTAINDGISGFGGIAKTLARRSGHTAKIL